MWTVRNPRSLESRISRCHVPPEGRNAPPSPNASWGPTGSEGRRLEGGAREIKAEIEIDAPAERVWKVLTDFEAFEQWNPFIVHAEGQPRQGERVVVTIRPPGRKATTFRPTVVFHHPYRELRWLGRLGIPGIFDGEHAHHLEALPGGRTRYVQRERFRGILVPFVGGMLRTPRRGSARWVRTSRRGRRR